MIVQTKTGVLLTGEIRTDPEIRAAGSRSVLKFDLRAASTKGADGKWQSTFVGVNLWQGMDRRDGMYQKGDMVTVTARELKSREYNGRTYYDLDADCILPGDLVILRWMQDLIDLMAQDPAPPLMTPTQETTPFDPPPPTPVQTSLDGAQLYPGETLADYAPRLSSPAVGTPEADRLIDEDAKDLPF